MEKIIVEFATLCDRLNIEPAAALNYLNSGSQEDPTVYANILPFTLPETDEL